MGCRLLVACGEVGRRWIGVGCVALVAALVPATASSAAVTPGAARLCRYTVRDIGFVALSGPRYTLVRVTDGPGEPLGDVAALERSSNLTLVAVDALAHADDPVVGIASGRARPTWVLSANDRPGRRLLLEAVTERGMALDAALDSPLRRRLLADTLGVFAFVLVVEGQDAERNAAAHALVARADESLAHLAVGLPRPVTRPLATLRVLPEERAAERVVLWSLGLDPNDGCTALVVLYGRGKRAGPCLVGETLEQRALLTQLGLVGDSCECEAPRDWAAEPSLPLRWDSGQRQLTAASLGFDPDSPLVRAEIVRTLERGIWSQAPPFLEQAEGSGATLFGYREARLARAQPVADVTRAESGAAKVTVYGAGDTDDDWSFDEVPQEADSLADSAHEPLPEGAAREQPGGASSSLLWSLGVLVLLAGGVTAFALWSRSRAS